VDSDDLEECEERLDEPGLGWIEDTHGGAVLIPYF
jgi:hypothetical protein